MKRILLLGSLAFAALFSSARAQQADPLGDVYVNITPRVVWGQISSTVTFSTYFRKNDVDQPISGVGAGTYTNMPQIAARLVPGVTYTMGFSVQDSTTPNPAQGQFGALGYAVMAYAPPGYTVQMRLAGDPYPPKPMNTFNGNFQGINSQTYTSYVQIRVMPPAAATGLSAGFATSLSASWTPWQLSLGTLANGLPAGDISFNILDSANTLATTFTRTDLTCDATASDINVINDVANTNAIRQVIAPQVCVDITSASFTSGAIQINCYHASQRSQNTDSNGYFTFTGQPFTAYTITPGANDAAGISITCVTVPTDSTRTLTTALMRSGSAPYYTWTAQDWHTGATPLVVSTRTRLSGSNTETITVADNNNATAFTTTRTYSPMLLDEEITSDQTGSSQSTTSTYTFYPGNVPGASSPIYSGWLQTVSHNDGSWQGFEYGPYGTLQVLHSPWLNSSSSGFPSETGRKTTMTFVGDAWGELTRPASSQTTISTATQAATTAAQSATTYTDDSANPIFAAYASSHPGLTVITAVRTDNWAAPVGNVTTNALTTTTKFFAENTGSPTPSNQNVPATDDFLRGQTYSVVQPTGAKTSFAYERGTWDPNAHTFTSSGHNGLDYVMPDGVTLALAVRSVAITGSSTTGTSDSSYDGFPIDPVYLVSGKSTLTITIRDQNADVVHTETQAWSGTAWNVVGSMNYTYSLAHQLTNRTNVLNGATYSAIYSGEQKQSETDETGTTVSYTYDAADRVATTTVAAAGSLGALTTQFTYDAAGHVLTKTVGYGQSETLVSTAAYDDTGRPTSQKAPGINAATISYDVANRAVTTTAPSGATKIETHNADGSVLSVTSSNSGVINEFYAYQLNSDGTIQTTRTNKGSGRCLLISVSALARAI